MQACSYASFEEGQEGCSWKGAPDRLEEHVRSCAFKTANCAHCGIKMQERSRVNHEKEECSKRPVCCGMGPCAVMVAASDRKAHWEECPHVAVQCPNKCETGDLFVTRGDVESHRRTCPLEMVPCDLAGPLKCLVRLPRKDMSSHKSEWPLHQQLALTRIHSLELALYSKEAPPGGAVSSTTPPASPGAAVTPKEKKATLEDSFIILDQPPISGPAPSRPELPSPTDSLSSSFSSVEFDSLMQAANTMPSLLSSSPTPVVGVSPPPNILPVPASSCPITKQVGLDCPAVSSSSCPASSSCSVSTMLEGIAKTSPSCPSPCYSSSAQSVSLAPEITSHQPSTPSESRTPGRSEEVKIVPQKATGADLLAPAPPPSKCPEDVPQSLSVWEKQTAVLLRTELLNAVMGFSASFRQEELVHLCRVTAGQPHQPFSMVRAGTRCKFFIEIMLLGRRIPLTGCLFYAAFTLNAKEWRPLVYINDLKSGQYEVVWLATQTGEVSISLKLGAARLPGGPIIVHVF